MPSTAGRLLDALGVQLDERTWEFTRLGRGAVGDVKGIALFEGKKIERGQDRKGKVRRG